MVTFTNMVFFTIIFLITTIIYGDIIYLYLQKYFFKDNKILTQLDFIDKSIIRVALGSIFIFILIVIFTLIGRILSLTSVWISFLLAVGITVYYHHKQIILYIQQINIKNKIVALRDSSAKKLDSIAISLRDYFSRTYVYTIKSVLILAVFWFYLEPAIGLNVYPGGDSRAYAFITLRILEEGGLTFSGGKYPYVVPGYHYIMVGFSALTAFFATFCQLNVGETQLLLIQISQAMISLAIYLFLKIKTNKVKIALSGLFMSAFLTRAHVDYFAWGGISESSALYIILVIIAITEIVSSTKLSITKAYIIGILALLAGLYHFYAILLFATYLASNLIYYAVVNVLKKDRKIIELKNSIFIILSIIFSPLLYFFYVEISNMPKYLDKFERSSRFYIPLITYNNLTLEGVYNAIIYFFTRYQSMIVLYLFIIGLLALKNNDLQETFIRIIIWTSILFLITENTPYGLFFIIYPGCHQIFPTRIYLEMFIHFSMLGSFGIWVLYDIISFALLKIMNVLQMLPNHVKHLTVYIKKYKSVFIWVILLLILIEPIYTTATYNQHILYSARKDAIVTNYDLQAFRWISKNTSEDAIFFTTGYDAGAWIPMYTNRIILPPFTLRQWTAITPFEEEALYKMIYETAYNKRLTIEVLYYFKYFNIDYVYVGAKTQYGLPRLDKNIFFNVTGFNLVFNNSRVFIFEINKKQLNKLITQLDNASNAISTNILNHEEYFYLHAANNYTTEGKVIQFSNETVDWVIRGDKLEYTLKVIIDNDNKNSGQVIFKGNGSEVIKPIYNAEVFFNESYFYEPGSLVWEFNTSQDHTEISYLPNKTISLVSDFIALTIKGNFSNNELTIILFDEFRNFRMYKTLLTTKNWERKIIPIEGYINAFGAFDKSRISEFRFILDLNDNFSDKRNNEITSVLIDNIQLVNGDWCDVSIKIPENIKLIDSNNNSIPEVYLLSNNKIFGYWDYLKTNFSLIDSANIHFMSGDTMSSIFGTKWLYGVALYPIAWHNTTVDSLPQTYDLVKVRKITYPTEYGKYIGFSIYIPPDDFLDSETTSISQIKVSILFVLDLDYFYSELNGDVNDG